MKSPIWLKHFHWLLVSLWLGLAGCGGGVDNSKSVPLPNLDVTRTDTSLIEKFRPKMYWQKLVLPDPFSCKGQSLQTFRDEKGHSLGQACPDDFQECVQSSCYVETNSGVRVLTPHKEEDKVYFTATRNQDCPTGLSQVDPKICLDPYFSVMVVGDGDLKLNDVIFVPKIKDVHLPWGGRHTGYFIVRDVMDPTEADPGTLYFFTGFDSGDSQKNPFRRLGFENISPSAPPQATDWEYSKATPPQAQQIMKDRAYPSIPDSLRQYLKGY